VDLSGIEVTASGKKLYNVGEKWLDYSDRVYGVSAQPYYVLMDHDKSNLITPFGYQDAPDIQTYKKNLQAGLAEFKKRKGL
jgi:thiol:disulfide interchange protein DsbD